MHTHQFTVFAVRSPGHWLGSGPLVAYPKAGSKASVRMGWNLEVLRNHLVPSSRYLLKELDSLQLHNQYPVCWFWLRVTQSLEASCCYFLHGSSTNKGSSGTLNSSHVSNCSDFPSLKKKNLRPHMIRLGPPENFLFAIK